MDLNIKKRIVAKIDEADMVLVGIGEELDQIIKANKNDTYIKLREKTESTWLFPFMKSILVEEQIEESKKIYHNLFHILDKKNYFVVSTCQDCLVRYGGFNLERIVEPCGGYSMLQCSDGCSTELYSVSEEFITQVRAVMNGEKSEKDLEPPRCPYCGKFLVFNNIDAEKYNEEGYLRKWMIYKKWLQGTVNKNLCILELGVGMNYPSVIRWPFEKIAFYNQKSELFRVHSRLYQITEEIKDRGYGICQKPEDFIRELSNTF
ncbi:hypothetical protein C819_02493 [Lachnospiraceae bacterium 10-1]|nr:hypothetical protein C819_02493 [Lachnospiraceae bacterium 10-1]